METLEKLTVIMFGISVILILLNKYILFKRDDIKELNKKVEFAIKFVDPIAPEDHTKFEMALFQFNKQQSLITGAIDPKSQRIQLTSTNDFIYEFYTGVQLDKLIFCLFDHHKNRPNEPLPWPLDNIECCPIEPFNMNN